jgi:hypothetical protein
MLRHAELKEQADSLPQGSAERKTLEKRISHREQYRLPKEDERDAGQREDVFDESGRKIGERHSMRKRMIERRRGRPRIHDQTPCSTAGEDSVRVTGERPQQAYDLQYRYFASRNASGIRGRSSG